MHLTQLRRQAFAEGGGGESACWLVCRPRRAPLLRRPHGGGVPPARAESPCPEVVLMRGPLPASRACGLKPTASASGQPTKLLCSCFGVRTGCAGPGGMWLTRVRCGPCRGDSDGNFCLTLWRVGSTFLTNRQAS